MRICKCGIILLVVATWLFSAKSLEKVSDNRSSSQNSKITQNTNIKILHKWIKPNTTLPRNMELIPEEAGKIFTGKRGFNVRNHHSKHELPLLSVSTDNRLLSGGPDGYGYTYKSNQDGDPVTFYWVEIRDTANEFHLADDDIVYVPLSFSFPFYDSTYDTLTIASNGLIYFEDYYIGTGNTALPSNAYGGGDIIAVFWDDLRPQPYGTGTVYFKDFQTFAVIEWDSVPIYGQTTYNTFEVIIYDDGLIKMQYLFMNYTQSDATIGIQDSSAYSTGNGWYLQYFYNGSPSGHTPTANTIVVFYPPAQYDHDVGVQSIDSPSDTVVTGYSVTPQVTVHNGGANPETCYVYFKIRDQGGNQVYSDVDTLYNLQPGSDTTLYFTSWTPQSVGTHWDTVYVVSPWDMNSSNDTLGGSFYARAPYAHDVGVQSIISPIPYDTIGTGDTLIPQATVRNEGLNPETCYVYFDIWDSLGNHVYSDVDTLYNLAPGSDAPLYFTRWTPTSVGPHTDTVSVVSPWDMNHSNDKMGSSFYAWYAYDVGAQSINSPYDTVAYGVPVTPQATVHNYGLNSASFSVTFNIYNAHGAQVYSSTNVVNNLGSGASASLSFPPWTPHSGGTFKNEIITDLPGDQNTPNDSLTSRTFVHMPGSDYLIIDLDPTKLSGPIVNSILQNLGYGGVYSTDTADLDYSTMSSYYAVWLMLGMFPHNYHLNSSQVSQIRSYLMNGGNMYTEGGDCWGYDPTRVNLDTLFGIDPANTSDGSSDLINLMGLSGGVSGLSEADTFVYYGENAWVDRLSILPSPPFGGQITPILYNYIADYYTGVAYSNSFYDAIALSHEIGGDYPNNPAGLKNAGHGGPHLLTDPPVDSLVSWFMQFIAYPPPPTGKDENKLLPKIFFLDQNSPNPFRGQTMISFGLPEATNVSLVVYDASGRKVKTLIHGRLEAGVHNIKWNGTDDNNIPLSAGVYFVKMNAGNRDITPRKVILLR